MIDGRRRRQVASQKTLLAALLMLSAGSGSADGFAFSQLGGVFTTAVTGDLTVVGVEGVRRLFGGAGTALAAVAAYTAGCALGFAVARTGRGVLSLWVGACLLQVAVGAVWNVEGHHLDAWPRGATIVGSALSMAGQTVLTQRLLGSLHASSTFMTGTLTALLRDLVSGDRMNRFGRAAAIAMVPFGAAVTALLLQAAPAFAATPPLVGLCAAAAVVVAGGGMSHRPGRSGRR